MRLAVVLITLNAVCASAQSGAPKRKSANDTTPPSVEQTIAVGLSHSSYAFGDSTVTEQNTTFAYDLSVKRVHLGIAGTSVNYGAPGHTVNGLIPTTWTLDWRFHEGDTLSFVGRIGAQPAGLDSTQVAALGLSGGALVDLQSASFGMRPMTGVHAVVTLPAGDLSFVLRGGLEIEPRPADGARTYWTGNTVFGGVTLSGAAGAGRLSGSLDLSTSSADSLNGKNLYPGGGEFSAHVDLHMPFDNPVTTGAEAWTTDWSAKLTNPISDTRNDQPNRRIPYGPITELTGALSVPIGAGSLGATLDYLSTSATANGRVGPATASTNASSSASIFTIDGSIPLFAGLELQPQVGFATGNSSLTVAGAARRPGRPARAPAASGVSVSTPLSGGWFGLTLSLSF